MSQPPECEMIMEDGVRCGQWVRESRAGEAVRVALSDGRVLFACERCIPPRKRGPRKSIPWSNGHAPHRTIEVDCADAPRFPARRARAISRNEPCPCGSGRKFKVCCRNRA